MLGNLEKVDLRSIWKNEASDFTQWLAKDENLLILGNEIGIELKLIKTEATVGNFSADILAEEESTGKKVIIENQLETTNHDHLGKLITYASGFDADYLIWIFKDIRDEHRQAIDWLNERANNSLNIFALKMELWKIGSSLPAPKFLTICSPNNWTKLLRQTSEESDLSDTNVEQLNFWTEFSEYIDKNSKRLKPRKARPQHWYTISIGSSHVHISLVASFQKNFIRAEIYIPDNKQLFQRLFEQKDEIERELGFVLEWQELPNAKACRIKIEKDNVNLSDKSTYQACFKWYLEKAEKYHEIFPKFF